jgi:transcriptional regulator with AAA-type ATPase domain
MSALNLNRDPTQTTILEASGPGQSRLMALTILWHPDLARVGAQAAGPAASGKWLLNRFAPAFCAAGQLAGAPLESNAISRSDLCLERHPDDSATLTPPHSKMAVEADGAALHGALRLDASQIERGVVLRLGGVVFLCLHWMGALPRHNPVGGLVGVSGPMVRARELILNAARHDLPVLLQAESGCGKELAARAVHAGSARRAAPLVSVNMAALSESTAVAELFGALRGAYTGAHTGRPGLFEEAGEGTLFMDEIGNTPEVVQPMLLRVLETGEYRPLGATRAAQARARIIAATDQPLGEHTFNQPLLRRLEAFPISLAPLRERREDIGLLVLDQLPAPKAASAPALPAWFLDHVFRFDWPGNVRQLQHVIRRASLLLDGGELTELSLMAQELFVPRAAAPPPEAAAPPAPPAPARPKPSQLSDDRVSAALEGAGWCVKHAARALDISRPSLYGLMRKNAVFAARLAALDGAALAAARADPDQHAARLRVPAELLRAYLRARTG